MAKTPSFPFYAQDFDMDTNTWSNEEIGVYLRLLMSEWINGPLPDDTQKLAQIARISHKKFKNLFQICSTKFVRNGNGFLINKKMEEIREKVNKWIEQKRKAGEASAEKRWPKDNGRYNERGNERYNERGNERGNVSKSNIYIKKKKKEKKERYLKETQEILDYLNKKFNRKFSDGTQITARLKNGGTVKQCKQIINTKAVDPYFQKNPHLFRPETLFRKSHWDSYLNQKPADFIVKDGPKPIAPYKPPKMPAEEERISTEEIRETVKNLKQGGLR